MSADDALALLIYDLQHGAAAVEAGLRRETPPPVFDAFNALAHRIGPEAFARSDALRRWNAGEDLTPDQVLAAPDAPPPEPSASAVLAAAAAVRDRVSRVLDAPAAPPPPRLPREPWPEPAPAPPPAEPVPTAPDAVEEPEPEPPPFIDASPASVEQVDEERTTAPPASPVTSSDHAPHGPALSDPAPREPLQRREPPPTHVAPLVSFERGGRARLWERLRRDPLVYMAVGACGAFLFLSALVGVATEKPNGMGLVLGLVGVLCLAPAVAFFLQRRKRD